MKDKYYQTTLEWRRRNPRIIQKYNKEYYDANKERIRQRRRERYQLKKQ